MRFFILHEQLTVVSRVTTQRTFFAKLIILENKSDKLIKSSHVKQRNGRIPSYHEYLWNGFRRDIAAIFLGLKPFCLILVYCEFFAIYRRCSDAFYIDDTSTHEKNSDPHKIFLVHQLGHLDVI